MNIFSKYFGKTLQQETKKASDTVRSYKQKILIVDNDSIHLEKVKAAFIAKYDVLSAKSCKEALKLFYKMQIPHLILMNLILLDMKWDAYIELKAMSDLFDSQIAFFTPSTDHENVKKMGAIDNIRKRNLLRRKGKILKKLAKYNIS